MKFIPSLLSGGSKKKKRSRISKADPSSFSSGSGSSSSSGSDSSVHLKETPKSILPSSCFSTTDRRLLLEIFNLFDHDRDGKISRHELEFLFTRLRVAPPSQEEVGMMLQEADQDGDGCISFEEFGALSSAFGPAGPPELRDAFDHFDKDGDGKISAEELLGFFSALGGDDGCTLEECRRMIAGVDREGKGFVGYDDFVRMMEGMAI
ncbi:putative calcium-binding protein CML18 [Cinnamomum micranthum f. kanehirae]|uniref:Putative calcium-binding protein CML18 n=1 Tax=Cinnamomum micranthum f. kanehirae TaxID=337451 RepID=A0A3S4NAJ1_9MAGN|nr:putative calcium-binding protein CML18 [Cinnamomum micranthum f. kanehirae]